MDDISSDVILSWIGTSGLKQPWQAWKSGRPRILRTRERGIPPICGLSHLSVNIFIIYATRTDDGSPVCRGLPRPDCPSWATCPPIPPHLRQYRVRSTPRCDRSSLSALSISQPEPTQPGGPFPGRPVASALTTRDCAARTCTLHARHLACPDHSPDVSASAARTCDRGPRFTPPDRPPTECPQHPASHRSRTCSIPFPMDYRWPSLPPTVTTRIPWA